MCLWLVKERKRKRERMEMDERMVGTEWKKFKKNHNEKLRSEGDKRKKMGKEKAEERRKEDKRKIG